MSIQFSVAVRNARLDVLETTIGASPLLDIRSGAVPADCAQADAGVELVHMSLPADYLNNAAGGAKTKNGTWQDNAVGDGSAGHFRIKDSTDTTCHIQGTVTATGGGGDMEMDNISIATSQPVTVNTFTLTDGNA